MRPLPPSSDRLSPHFPPLITNPPEVPHPSGRISRLANRVNTITLADPRSSTNVEEHPSQSLTEQLPTFLSPSFFNSYLDVPSTPWYRFCRPVAPIPDQVSFSTSSFHPPFLGFLVETQIDQENANLPPQSEQLFPTLHDDLGDEELLQIPTNPVLIPSPRQERTASVKPLSAVSNILQSPIMFCERIPKWSLLHRQSTGVVPEALEIPRISSLDLRATPDSRSNEEEEQRRTPLTPPVSAFLASSRSCCFTNQAALGLTRPTVLKREHLKESSSLSEADEDAYRSPPTKRFAKWWNSDEVSVKRSRFHPLVPSEHSAFIPVRSKRQH